MPRGHKFALEAPEETTYEPAGAFVQLEDPTSANVPAEHTLHAVDDKVDPAGSDTPV